MNARIKQIREKQGLTQEEFGKRIGSARNTIANYESGNRCPSNAVVNSICREFKVNEHWLRTGEGEPFKQRLPTEEIAEYVGKLLDYDRNSGNPFYDMIIEMMEAYDTMDSDSQKVIRNYFGRIRESMKEKEED